MGEQEGMIHLLEAALAKIKGGKIASVAIVMVAEENRSELTYSGDVGAPLVGALAMAQVALAMNCRERD